MKIVNFNHEGRIALGIKLDKGVLEVSVAAERLGLSAPSDVHDLIAGGKQALASLETLAQAAVRENALEDAWLDEEKLEWEACVPRPGKIICVGLNYKKHAEETGQAIPPYPVLFSKYSNTVNAHKRDVPLPKISSKVDYEVELAVVIGKPTKYVSKEDALSHVFGYCIANDVSARDLQLRTSQWLYGKSCDGFSPIGPYLVTADEVGDPNRLELKLSLNGEVRQHSNTSDMIFTVAEIVSDISQAMTLEPGDVIFTGTPEGVIMGLPEDRQQYLKDGDIVSVEIEKLGVLVNRMVSE